jgi:DNA-binding transcriptional regulator YiaG
MAATKISADGRMASGSSRTRSGAGRRRKKAVKAASSLGRTIQVRGVRNRLGVSQEELARITGYSVRAIAGWESGKKLSGPARQKVAETERLRAALAEIVPPAELGEWMRTPNSAFEGQTPIQVIERGEADRIWRVIIQIDSGVAN